MIGTSSHFRRTLRKDRCSACGSWARSWWSGGTSGKVVVWKDLCIHRGARLSKGWVVDGTVVCPYHGWRYDGEAKCVFIPAHPDTPPPLKARAFPHRAEERYGFIWASLGDPPHDVPRFPEWGGSGIQNLPRRSLPVRRQCIPIGGELHRRHAFPVRACRPQRRDDEAGQAQRLQSHERSGRARDDRGTRASALRRPPANSGRCGIPLSLLPADHRLFPQVRADHRSRTGASRLRCTIHSARS